MSNFSKFEFVTLDILKFFFLLLILDAEIYLDVIGLRDTMKE